MRWGGTLLVLLASGCASTTRPIAVQEAPPALVQARLATSTSGPIVLESPADEPAAIAADDEAPVAEIDDGLELSHGEGAHPSANGAARTEPKKITIPLSDSEILQKVKSDLSSLGPMSVGRTSQGALVNAVPMPEGDNWAVVDPHAAYGTQETIDFLTAAINRVAREFPDTAKMHIGHLSAKQGGSLRPHKSHQSGRDVDVSYYYKAELPFKWYRRANADNLDRARTWAFVRALITDTDVELIFINTSVQQLLKEYALSVGEDREWLDSIFQYGQKHHWPIIRHAHGHDTHIHVRFFNPKSQEMGRRALAALVDRGLVTPQVYHSRYLVKKGDILGRIAKRFDTTVRKIQEANRLRGTLIQAGKSLIIPRRGQVSAPGLTVIPPRRLPPSGSGEQSVSAAQSRSQ